MKEIFAFLDTGVSLLIPDGMDVESDECADLIRNQFRQLIMSQDPVDYLIEGEF